MSLNNGNAANVFKVSDEIQSRLFNHKQFTGGEIRFFNTAFEGKREWREEKKLNDCVLILKQMNQIAAKSCERFANNTFLEILSKMDCNLNTSEHIVGSEKEFEDCRALRIKDRKEEINQESQLFFEEIEKKKSEIDNNWAAKEEEIKLQYKNLAEVLKGNV